jgi:iron(III) transport system substrate-binding protein
MSRALSGSAATLLLACVGALLFGAPTHAQTASDPAAIATYTGPDRDKRLTDGGKTEGVVSIYSSAQTEDMNVITAAFEKKYGIKTRLWRGSSEDILQRTVVEARGRRYDVDVIETNGNALEALHRENLMQAFDSPVLVELIPGAIRPHREWVGSRINIVVSARNTNLVKKEEVPASYEALLDPKWKGKLGIESDDVDWFGAVVTNMGEAKGLKLFRDIVATNGISIRKGHTLLTNLVISGEVPLALTAYHYKAEQMKNAGAPLDWFSISPTFAQAIGIGMAKRAPHPNAAVRFIDFWLTEGQEILAKRDFTPVNVKAMPSLKTLDLQFIDPNLLLDEGEKWSKLYKETFANR